MWIKFNKLGVVQEYLKHGNLPEVGDTAFEIFAFFEDVDLNYYNTATIRFQKPDLNETEYQDLFMVQAQKKFVPYLGDTPSTFFREDHYYIGFVFNFGGFEGSDNDIPILLDTPGRWKATITLYSSSGGIVQGYRNVTGMIEFNVNDSISSSDYENETELGMSDIIKNIAHRLTSQLEKLSGNYLRLAQDFTKQATDGELDPVTYTVGTFVYDLKTEKFYRVTSISESQSHPGMVEATFQDYKYILDRTIPTNMCMGTLYSLYKDQNVVFAEIGGEKGFLFMENLAEENNDNVVKIRATFVSEKMTRYVVYTSQLGYIGNVGNDLVTVLNETEDRNTDYGEVTAQTYVFSKDFFEALEQKQDKLIAGNGISIDGNVISATSGISVVDDHLSLESANPVQNKVITQAINQKQDIIQFIYITSTSGRLEDDELSLLSMNKVNRLIYNNIIYYLSVVNGQTRKYFSKNQSSSNNEIDVNMSSGWYDVISKMDPVLENHINNTTIHITEEERLFWNNKVSATVGVNEINDLTLKLSNGQEEN